MKTMPNSTKEERLRWIQPILDRKIMIKDLAEVCPFSIRTINYWLARYRREGEAGLEPRSTRPKTFPRETPIRLKEEVVERRRTTGLAAQKLHWQLAKEQIDLHPRTIGKIIKREGLTRRYRTRKMKYRYLRSPLRIGQLVEIDIKYVPGRVDGQRYYQYTAIDCASRWRHLEVFAEKSNQSALRFLTKLIQIAPFPIQAVKTDNDSCFTNRYVGYPKSRDPLSPRLHPFDQQCAKLGLEHYLIDPGHPAQNGRVERSHRSDQESFYRMIQLNSAEELRLKIRLWNMYYNDLEHCGLGGLTPNEFLRLEMQNVCT